MTGRRLLDEAQPVAETIDAQRPAQEIRRLEGRQDPRAARPSPACTPICTYKTRHLSTHTDLARHLLLPKIMRVIGFALLLSMVSMVACGGESPTPKRSAKVDTTSDSSEPTDGTTEIGSTETETTDTTDSPPAQTPPESDTTATTVNLGWNALGKFVYSLDVKTQEGDWVGPCLDVSILGSATAATFKGVCTSAGGKAVPKPAAYRLYFSRSDVEVQHWQDFVEVTPPSGSENVVFKLPTSAPAGVALNWTAKSATANYSLDVFLMNGERIRPCVSVDALGNATSIWFDGSCTAAPSPRRINLKDVKDFVICSAENNDWKAATCSGIPYTGFGTSRTIPN